MHRLHTASGLVVLFAALAGCGTTVSGGGAGGSGGGDPGEVSSTAASATVATTGGTGAADPGSGAGGPGGVAPYALDCGAYERCPQSEEGDPPVTCPSGTECVSYPGCITPICIAYDDACDAHCGLGIGCAILESYPVQLDCDGDGSVPGTDDPTCDDLQAELDAIQACTADDQCGRVLEGTSCGCTRALVARNDVPVAVFEALRVALEDVCGFGSTCDCPEADGFACVDGRCSWNYLDP
jgi:hypothetical protein